MRITHTPYYCMYTKINNVVPRCSPLFSTEQGSRTHAKQLIIQGYWGVIARHREWEQDLETWHVDEEDTSERAVEMLESF